MRSIQFVTRNEKGMRRGSSLGNSPSLWLRAEMSHPASPTKMDFQDPTHMLLLRFREQGRPRGQSSVGLGQVGLF